MVTIKIECPCGQHYAFDVEPVNGRVPSPVACPACGVEGTAAANALLAEKFGAQAAPVANPVAGTGGAAGEGAGAPIRLAAAPAAPARPAGVRLAASPTPAAAAPRRPVRTTEPPNRTQAQFEARARISWGDPPHEVAGYLLTQGFDYEQASAMVQELVRERNAAIRGTGIKYIVGGIGMVCVPVAATCYFWSVGYIYVKTYLITIVIGLGGIGLAIKGASMVVSPKSQQGDVAEQ
jgi:hypothetical protein